MGIQSALNQSLALGAGLLTLNPELQAKARERQEIKQNEKEITNARANLNRMSNAGSELTGDLPKEEAESVSKFLDARTENSANTLIDKTIRNAVLTGNEEQYDVLSAIKEAGRNTAYPWSASTQEGFAMEQSMAQKDEARALNDLQQRTDTLIEQKSAMEQRREIISRNMSLRQQMKLQGATAKEIRNAYSNTKKGGER